MFSRKEVSAVVQAINFLTTHIHFPGLFRIQDNRQNVIQIVKRLTKGDPKLFHFLYENCTALDCSNGLNQYLVKHKPLLPHRIQSLIAASNDGVTTKTIALDALGLLFDELRNCNNFILIYKLLDMMRALIMRGSQRPTETRVCYGPFILLPMFFEQTREVILNYKRICDVIHEMILMSGLLRSSNELSRVILQNRLSYDIQNNWTETMQKRPNLVKSRIFHRCSLTERY